MLRYVHGEEWIDELTDAALSGADPTTTTLVAFPATTQRGLGLELLTATGRRPGLDATSWDQPRLWQAVALWLPEAHIYHVVVLAAQHLHARCIAALDGLSRCTTLLVFDGTHLPRRLASALTNHERVRARDHGLIACVTDDRLTGPTEVPPAVAEDVFPACPIDAFPFFYPACLATLTDKVRQRFLRRYEEARSTTRWLFVESGRDDPELDHAKAADHLRALASTCENTHERLVCLRAAEHAFFEEGWLLKVDPDRLAAGTPALPSTAEITRRLRWYVNPRTAAIGSLAACGLSASAIASLNADQAFSGRTSLSTRREIQLGEQSIILPSGLEGLVGAYGRWAFTAPITARTGALFPRQNGSRLHAKAIKSILRTIAEETGLPLAAHWTPPADQRATAWMRRLGISLQQL